MENHFPFFLLSLAVWRVASLFAKEDGPFDIFTRIRVLARVQEVGTDKQYGTNWFNRGLICVWCSSVWIGLFAAPLLAPDTIIQYFILALALSTTAVVLDSFINR